MSTIQTGIQPLKITNPSKKPSTFSYTALAVNEIPTTNVAEQPITTTYTPAAKVAKPTKPAMVAIVKTINNEPKKESAKQKPFKLPSLAWVVLEVGGLGLIGFVGNYLGRLQYCEKTKKVVAGGIKTFDSMTSHHQALKKGTASFLGGKGAFPTQVEGSWLGHANQLFALIQEYKQNPASFTGAKLTNSTPEEIRLLLHQYTNTVLNYYQRAGVSGKQVEVAHLLYNHKLSIPPEAYNDKTIALNTFLKAQGTPVDLWPVAKINSVSEILSNTGVDFPSTQSYKSWKQDFATFAKTWMNQKEEQAKTPAQAASYQQRTLRLINNYTALMESFHILQTLPTNANHYKTPELMEDFWISHLNDLKLIDQKGDPIELLLTLKTLETILKQYGEKEKAWQVGMALKKLSTRLKRHPETVDCTEPLFELNRFIADDLCYVTVKQASPLPTTLYKWMNNQAGQLGLGNPQEHTLLTNLLDCVKPLNQHNTNQKNQDRLLNFYGTLKEDPATSLFILKLWTKLFNATTPETNQKPLMINNLIGEGSFPKNQARYDAVGSIFRQVDGLLTTNKLA